MDGKESRMGFAQLVFVLSVLTAGVTYMMFWKGGIPFLGHLPGDFVFLLPSGEIFLPATSSVVISIVVLALAYLFTASRNQEEE